MVDTMSVLHLFDVHLNGFYETYETYLGAVFEVKWQSRYMQLLITSIFRVIPYPILTSFHVLRSWVMPSLYDTKSPPLVKESCPE